jgi:hypothetical protein
MRWNQLRSKSTSHTGYTRQIYDELSGNTFMHRWAQEFEERGLHKRILVDDSFVASWHKRKPAGRRIRGFEYNYIHPSVFKIGDNCDVYDNVIAYFQYKDGEMFGIEIYNQDIADTQRQFFEMVWAKSKPETRF